MAMKKAAPKKAAPKKGGDLAGVESDGKMGRTAKRGLDQANRKLTEPRTRLGILANQIKKEQSNKGDMGKQRTSKRFETQDKKVTKKMDTKQMANSVKKKQYLERKRGQ